MISFTPCEQKPCAEGLVRYEGECLAAPPPCGEPPGDCVATLDATGCDVAGGSYNEWWDYCNCSTRDGGCPCWRGNHCQGMCLGGQRDLDDCRAVEVGVCGDTNGTGCLYIATYNPETGQPWFDLVCLN